MLLAAAETAPNLIRFDIPTWHWVVLITWFAALLIGDIVFLHRDDKTPTLRTATIQSLIWIGLGIGLGLLFWPLYGATASAQYFSGYLIEKSLSIDNVFAWSVILTYFSIPKKYQHRVLFWGVFGALVFRAIFIFAGIALIEQFEPILLVFGGILIFSGIKLFLNSGDSEFDPVNSKALKHFSRLIPISHKLDGHKLFTRENGKHVATILFVALLAIELTDVIFAIDSVPAILAISQDPFIVFASNAAAILGLRALYFVFDQIKDRFWLLSKGLGVLLVIIGIKMFISPSELFGITWFNIHVPTGISLAIIATFLGGTMLLSWFIPPPENMRHHSS